MYELRAFYHINTKYNLRWELSLDAADVLLHDLPVPDLLLHLTGLLGVPEHGKPSTFGFLNMGNLQP